MIGIAAWWLNRHNTYETIIPAEAKLVIKIDMKTCMNNPIIQQKFQDLQQKALKNIQGIDWENLYTYSLPPTNISVP